MSAQPSPSQVHVETYMGNTSDGPKKMPGKKKLRREAERMSRAGLSKSEIIPFLTSWDRLEKGEQERREQLGKEGKAFRNADGHYSYPIDSDDELHKAIKAVGRGKASHAAIRSYIKRVASKMGKSDAIPADWKAEKSENVGAIWKSETQHLVYGVVLAPEWTDSQDDIIGADEIEKAAHEFMELHRKHDVQHDETIIDARPVESWIAPEDLYMGEPKQLVTKGSWVMGVRVTDDAAWGRIVKGELTGFSIGGSAFRIPEGE